MSKSLKTLKTKLDKVFSKYIRLKAADRNGYVRCFTCFGRVFWKTAHCGHFISRRNLALRWDERNVAPQCAICNLFGEGQKHIWTVKLIDRYGKDYVDNLIKESKKSVKLTREDIENLIKHYEEKLKELKRIPEDGQ